MPMLLTVYPSVLLPVMNDWAALESSDVPVPRVTTVVSVVWPVLLISVVTAAWRDGAPMEGCQGDHDRQPMSMRETIARRGDAIMTFLRLARAKNSGGGG